VLINYSSSSIVGVLVPRLRVYSRSLILALSLIPSSNLISSSYIHSLVTRLKVLLG
jgi:hypothetical protein